MNWKESGEREEEIIKNKNNQKQERAKEGDGLRARTVQLVHDFKPATSISQIKASKEMPNG